MTWKSFNNFILISLLLFNILLFCGFIVNDNMWANILFIKPLSLISIIAHFFITKRLKNSNDIRFGYAGISFMIILLFLCSRIDKWRNLKEIKLANTPCPREILINNNNGKLKEEFIFTMCSEYNTKFGGKWDGKHIILDSGKIPYPHSMDKYMDIPIKKVKLQPKIYSIYSEEPFFNPDTLKTGQTYYFYGIFNGIENNTPIMSISKVYD